MDRIIAYLKGSDCHYTYDNDGMCEVLRAPGETLDTLFLIARQDGMFYKLSDGGIHFYSRIKTEKPKQKITHIQF